ncbi:MAG: hypothetical protein WBQ00_03105 [Terriglobales bacterium]
MACPYFVPREIVYDLSWPHPARLPLGAGWTGTCCAASHKSANGAVAPNIADSSVAGSIITGANILEPNLADPTASSIAATLAVDSAIIRDCCNLGYATACPHLPVGRDWDAIRFTIVGSAPKQITLCFVCELAHAPKAHGTLTYDLTTQAWREAPAPSTNEASANDAPANVAAPVTTAATASAASDARVRRLAASYLYAHRLRQSAGQSLGQNDDQSAVQTGATA